ncbi:sperm-associated antigen 16 protein-like [Cuculus canorus]|uniref:sperm-associated antigen 16 protein-like n=1 Tax=Cuculus canorus TaxID=55661 RepID=UPI0023AA4424|nr:sperm-associated antigen 16 protein-like [Cuculus canorus]
MMYLQDSECLVDTQVSPDLVPTEEHTQPLKSGEYKLSSVFKEHNSSSELLGVTSPPKKDIVVTGGGDRLWKMWALRDGNIILTGEGHTDCLSGCCFHPSERCRCMMGGRKDSVNSTGVLLFSSTVLTSSADETLSLWDASRRLMERWNNSPGKQSQPQA